MDSIQTPLIPLDCHIPVFGQSSSLVVGGAAEDTRNSLLNPRDSSMTVGNAGAMEVHFLSAAGTSPDVPLTPTRGTSPNGEAIIWRSGFICMEGRAQGCRMAYRVATKAYGGKVAHTPPCSLHNFPTSSSDQKCAN